MPPFATYWKGLDADDRFDLGLMSDQQADDERARMAKTRAAVVREMRRRKLLGRGEPSAQDVYRAVLLALGKSRAHVVLANLEDLWGETQSQNVPGTTGERVNWRRKARYTLEEMKDASNVIDPLSALNEARTRRRGARRMK
jgi:4-alpha-glucanotransferase